jgi:hypothetical protein
MNKENKDTNGMKRQATELSNLFAKHIPDKELYTNYTK